MDRRRFLSSGSALIGASSLPGLAGAQGWPSRAIKFVSQDGAGGAVDARLRDFIVPLSEELKATLIVENKPGAAGQIAHQAVLTQPADGYTVLLANATMTIVPSLYRKLPYSTLKDFTPVAYSGVSAIGLAIPSTRPETTLKQWLGWARTQKGSLNYGSGGNGTVQHLYGFQVNDQFGLEATHVPYKSAVQFLPDLAGGRLDYAMLDILSLRAFVQRGTLRILATTGNARSPYLPEVPTFAELGFDRYDRMGWTAYYVRAGTPQDVVDRLASAISKVSATPEWDAKRKAIWSLYEPLGARELAERVRSETDAWGELIQRTGVHAD